MLQEMFNILDSNEIISDKAKIYSNRRKELLSRIEQTHSGKKGKVVLFAPIEQADVKFVQDASYLYYTGILESATTVVFDLQSGTHLYKPNFGGLREIWIYSEQIFNKDTISLFGIDHMHNLGELMKDYQVHPYFASADYQYIIQLLSDMIAQKMSVFTLYPSNAYQYVRVRQIIDRLALFVPQLHNYIVDISPIVAAMRRKKEMVEIEQLYQAVGITHAGFQAAARLLKPGILEAELQAAIEYIFIENGARNAYPVIVAGGKRATVLHYDVNNQNLNDGELVLIDAGAMYNHYCADITRVFPVSGTFSAEQKILYNIVLEVQQHVVEHVRPGMWLSNVEQQDASLQHIAIKFLKKQGYDKYFMHGIGHYLGLDVHDVGDRLMPLQEGDVITIEPGIYMPDKEIGIRIEDNYWIVADAEPVCLSEDISKNISEVERMLQESF